VNETVTKGKVCGVLFLSLFLVAIGVGMWANNTNPTVDANVIQELSKIPQGEGVTAAASYTNRSGIHPIVLLDFAGKAHPWTSRVRVEWGPANITSVELVVLVEEEREKVLETVEYYGPSITRYQYYLNVQLRAARTGRTVANTTLYGSLPRLCQQSEDYYLTRLAGSHVSFDQLKEWLKPYVNPNN
jgi:hypothetical protein